nr:polysaccharide pyruvyl transferase family protein [Polynucleobacter sp. AP-Feld-500C-C5]
MIEKGYLVETISVSEIASLDLYRFDSNAIDSGKLLIKILQKNERIYRLILATDVVVVNGEGTLHGANQAPVNLLYLIFILKRYLNKKVHLINTAIFPNSLTDFSGDNNTAAVISQLYMFCLQDLDLIATRDEYSASNLKALKLNCVDSFDCLPRFIARNQLVNSATRHQGYLISGGIALSKKHCETLAFILNSKIDLDKPIYFLSGAKSLPVDSDKTQFEWFQKHLPNLKWLYANSMQEWLSFIARSEWIISGRFHHSLAAATLGTPFLSLSSNTPKIKAALAILGLPNQISLENEVEIKKTENEISKILVDPRFASTEKVNMVIKLAESNFIGI